ncbi:hypothetical protein HII36_20065 [Nonomuraea sp. NN258]|uniref:hypothetical protein n=1 Tax=Nonomuraea antri TaxID=2730852 RepID=UPI00156A4CED|nr:hypothetical protein [Nonomuraea antri]NRQ34131.1 hypothetical protein [Nonomuraea antri]
MPEPEPLDWGAPVTAAWREGAITRIHELDSLYRWMLAAPPALGAASLTGDIRRHLDQAAAAAEQARNPYRSFTGAAFERVSSNCDAAEAHLLRVAPDGYLLGQLPSLVTHVRRHLAPDDARLLALVRIAAGRENGPRWTRFGRRVEPLGERERTTIVSAVRGASSEAGREQSRVRSFRNVLTITTAFLVLLAVAVGVLGALNPTAVPLCFTPERGGEVLVVCPTAQSTLGRVGSPHDIDEVVRATAAAQDLVTVEVVGLVAAAIAAATGLRKLRGSSVPFGLPVALAVLKLPTGALTAFLGLLLMRGQFIPGLSALDSSAQVIAWAVIFGYAQQVFTHFVDQQAQNVLNRVRGRAPEQGRPAAAG